MPGLELFDQQFHVGLDGFPGGLGAWGWMGWSGCWRWWSWLLAPWALVLPFCVAALNQMPNATWRRRVGQSPWGGLVPASSVL